MFFNRNYSMQSRKPADELKNNIVGKHFKVHNLDFEVMDKDEVVKIIPHAEDDERLLTLPIIHLLFKRGTNKTRVFFKSHPRRIDAGGPLIMFITFIAAVVVGMLIGIYADESYNNVAKIICGLGLVGLIIFWVRMELGYFDYIRKIKGWVQSQL